MNRTATEALDADTIDPDALAVDDIGARRPSPEGERGSVSIAGAIFGIGIFLLVGLVLMQGQSLGSLSRTREAADNAARAGAQQIDTDHLLGTGELRIDPTLATQAVSAYAANLPTMRVTSVEVVGPTITVTMAETITPIGAVGRTRTFTATESATALQGVTGAIE
ncbi:MAG: hypothetical protein WBM50_10005 [Acidimicrobiales bacterium]